MNGTYAFALIERLAKLGKKDKEATLASYKDDEFLRKVFLYTFNPAWTYGISTKSMPKFPTDHGSKEITLESVWVWEALDQLRDRKLTGNAAKDHIAWMFQQLTRENAELLRRIILQDMRAGFTVNTVNRAMDDLIYVFTVMLAHPFDEKRVQKILDKCGFVYGQPKLDGYRATNMIGASMQFFGDGKAACIENSDAAVLYTRTGNVYDTLDHVKAPLIAVTKAFNRGPQVIETEVVSGNFNETSSALRGSDKKALDATIYVFDIIPIEHFNGDTAKAGNYVGRLGLLDQFMANVPAGVRVEKVETVKLTSIEECHEYYAKCRAKGLEGAMIKDPSAPYVRDRDYAWMKMKAQETADVTITDVLPGDPGKKYENTCGRLVFVTEAGAEGKCSGMSDAERDEFWKNKDQYIGRVIELEYHELTPDGVPRHPRFVRFRPDKDKLKTAA